MISGNNILRGEVGAAYAELISAFEDASAKSNGGSIASTGRFSLEHGRVVNLDAYLHLAKCNARQDEVSVLVHVQERAERSQPILHRSTVRVCYYRIEQNDAVLRHSIHFDYGKSEDFHPVFHAQLCTDDVTLSDVDAQAIDFPYRRVHTTTCFREARIPTSDMTFPSVLLCLAADHYRASFRTFLELVRSVQDKMPMPSLDATRLSLGNPLKHFRSSHWFAHMS